MAVQSGHSLSKDWSGGIITLIWLLKYFGRGKVILTAPTDRQVREVMFGEIEKQYAILSENHPEFKKSYLTGTKLDFGPQCFALGLTTKETGGLVGKFHGFKSENILIIVSEAQAVAHSTFLQTRGLLTSGNARILELGNPMVEYGDFYDHCTDPARGYHVIKLSCFDSPNVIAGKKIMPGVVEIEFVEMMRQEVRGDETDPEWQSRVLGEFPQQSMNAWIPLAKIRAAVGRKFVDEDDMRVGGLDTARKGADETVHCVLQGRTQVKQDCFKKVLTPETVGWARGLIEAEQLEAMAIDEGYNPGVGDWLVHERMPVSFINFGAESPDERFENFGTYMWFLLRNAFMDGEISIMDDPMLVSQLASRRVEMTPKGKRKLESKKESNQKSPDRADALAMAWYTRLSALGNVPDFGVDGDEESQATSLHDMISHVLPAPRQSRHSAIENDDDVGVVEANTIRY